RRRAAQRSGHHLDPFRVHDTRACGGDACGVGAGGASKFTEAASRRCMRAPRYSVRRLLSGVAIFSVGLGAIASMRAPGLDHGPTMHLSVVTSWYGGWALMGAGALMPFRTGLGILIGTAGALAAILWFVSC